MIKEAIILAGGLGTRLRSAVPDLPKCMAPILAKPFIGYLIDYLLEQGIERFIFALGYKYEVVEQYLATQYGNVNGIFSVEKEPMGTGGAIRLACSHAASKNVLVVNGDTFFTTDIRELSVFHDEHQADCTLCLKPLENFDRYSIVEINEDFTVTAFKKRRFYEQGLINGGVYALQVPEFLRTTPFGSFSFEKDYLEEFYRSEKFFGFIQNKYFIDIGVPEDFERAQTELLLNR